jgi:hypothetical protein
LAGSGSGRNPGKLSKVFIIRITAKLTKILKSCLQLVS